MEVKEREIKGVFEITLSPINDERGFFMRVLDDKFFDDCNINRKWVQENHSKSNQKGIIRGLHLQIPPFAETKLIRCIRGAIFDVFIDLRKESESFGKWGSVELSEENKKMILIPHGFAHGFCTLTEISEVLYKVDNYYSKEHEVGLLWKDDKLKIDWPVSGPVLSSKDLTNITFDEFLKQYQGI